MYEGCEESCESSLIRDFHFLSAAGRRASSNCELRIGSSTGYQPARSSSDAQIPRFHHLSNKRKTVNSSTLERLDLDSLSVDFMTDTDAQQSFISTSPQSVDSGLECLMMEATNSSTSSCSSASSGAVGLHSSSFSKRLLRSSGYECDNSTDSTDSGVFSGRRLLKKRSVCSNTDSEDSSESDAELFRLPDCSSVQSIEAEEGELTPVLEVSRAEEFGDGQMKKRRLMMEPVTDDESDGGQNCWEDYVDVRMIDFAHTTFSGYLGLDETVHWGPDNGYLLGLDSLTGILSELRSCCASC